MQGIYGRRDRWRAETSREILQAARRVLVQHGREGVTLRAVAGELGMTASALYRYFDSHEELLRRLADDIDASLSDDLRTAFEAVPARETSRRFVVACTEFRRWALAHKHEYTMTREVSRPDSLAAGGRVFLDLFEVLWWERPAAGAGLVNLPAEGMAAFLSCWIRLHGFVTLEVDGRLPPVIEDALPVFDLLMAGIASDVGHLSRSPTSKGEHRGRDHHARQLDGNA